MKGGERARTYVVNVSELRSCISPPLGILFDLFDLTARLARHCGES